MRSRCGHVARASEAIERPLKDLINALGNVDNPAVLRDNTRTVHTYRDSFCREVKEILGNFSCIVSYVMRESEQHVILWIHFGILDVSRILFFWPLFRSRPPSSVLSRAFFIRRVKSLCSSRSRPPFVLESILGPFYISCDSFFRSSSISSAD